MPGWATFWWWIGFIDFFAFVISIVTFNPALIFSLLFSSLFFFTVSRALRCITDLMESADVIKKNQNKILSNQFIIARRINDRPVLQGEMEE